MFFWLFTFYKSPEFQEISAVPAITQFGVNVGDPHLNPDKSIEWEITKDKNPWWEP